MSREERPENDTLLDEVAAAYASGDDLLILRRSKDEKFGMRVRGFLGKNGHWSAVALLEWGKFELLSDNEKGPLQ